MVPEISLYLPNVPGQFSRVLTALARASINISAFSVDLGGATSQLRLLFQDNDEAARAFHELEHVPYQPVTRTLLLLSVPHKPGATLVVADTLSRNGINIEYGYVALGQTETGKIFLALKVDDDDTELAIQLLKEQGIDDHDQFPAAKT